MRELTQVRDAVIAALRAAGLEAGAAFPDGPVPERAGASAAVAVGAAAGRELGFCNYLGEIAAEDGSVRELYGKQLEGEITVELRAGRAAACEAGCETAAEVLLGGLPSGIRPGELRWEALCWEKATGMFLRRGRLQCRALFLSRAQEEGAAFADFILKGVILN